MTVDINELAARLTETYGATLAELVADWDSDDRLLLACEEMIEVLGHNLLTADARMDDILAYAGEVEVVTWVDYISDMLDAE
jgi:hypothetical protein